MASCDCKKKTEERLKEHYAGMIPGARSLEVSLKGYAITFGKGLSFRPFMPVEATHLVTAKSTGVEKQKTEKTNMFFNFCPFCGVDIRDKPEPDPSDQSSSTNQPA